MHVCMYTASLERYLGDQTSVGIFVLSRHLEGTPSVLWVFPSYQRTRKARAFSAPAVSLIPPGATYPKGVLFFSGLKSYFFVLNVHVAVIIKR